MYLSGTPYATKRLVAVLASARTSAPCTQPSCRRSRPSRALAAPGLGLRDCPKPGPAQQGMGFRAVSQGYRWRSGTQLFAACPVETVLAPIACISIGNDSCRSRCQYCQAWWPGP